jgi:hypothetical protein
MKLLLAGVLSAAALLSAAPAGADPNDPHVPNWSIDWCPGGGTLRANAYALPNIGGYAGYCDGVPYEDGSYLHQVPQVPSGISGFGATIETSCRINKGSMFSPPAPPGGCGGDDR